MWILHGRADATPDPTRVGCRETGSTSRKMRTLETRLGGPILIEPQVLGDERGFFSETYRRNVFGELGISEEMVQDNHSRSRRGVVRGMHFQIGKGAAKLVRCATGAIFDVLVDIRRGSPTFGEWEGFELSAENMRIAYCPIGFAHGFCNYYVPRDERGIKYDDPDVGITWPDGLKLVASERDLAAPLLRDVANELPFVYER
jgi:dTDP-4-dehydrorhamnose 3,5-epimerase